jgi:hypothetical protein
MLVQRQLTNRILGDAQRLRKESLELHHTCRNTMSVSKLLRELLQEERKSRPSKLGCVFRSIPATDSGRFRPPIPVQTGHRSGAFRPPPLRT